MPKEPTPEQAQAELELATRYADFFREVLRGICFEDTGWRTNQVMKAIAAIAEARSSIPHEYSAFDIVEQALMQFRDPPDLSGLDAARLELARAGIRLLATRTALHKRGAPGHASQLARDVAFFDKRVDWFEQMRRL
jgi:hypothetical protein